MLFSRSHKEDGSVNEERVLDEQQPLLLVMLPSRDCFSAHQELWDRSSFDCMISK